jgi:hypothetical protein
MTPFTVKSMNSGELNRELKEALENGKKFGPEKADDPLWEISGRELREFLRSRPRDEAGENQLWLYRIRVEEALDLEAQRIGPRLIFEQWEFEGPILLSEAEAITIGLIDCKVEASLLASQINVHRNLLLNGLVGNESIWLNEAIIGGQLSLAGVELTPREGAEKAPVLSLDIAKIGGDVVATKLKAQGEVRLLGANVEGYVTLDEAELGSRPGEPAIRAACFADGLRVGQNLNCRDLHAIGGFRMLGAFIGGQVSFLNAHLSGGEGEGDSPALFADRAVVKGSVFLDQLQTLGEVHMVNAQIDGLLSVDEAQLDPGSRGVEKPARAFSGDGLKVGGDVLCRGGFTAKGEIRLLGSSISGSLWMDGATLEAKATPACLALDRAEIGEGLRCKQITAKGEVRLHGVKVGGFISLDDGIFEGVKDRNGKVGPSLNASRASVVGTVHCPNLFAKGEMRFIGAKIGGQLGLVNARLVNSPDRTCLNLISAQIDELLLALSEVEGTVDLRDATIRSFWDAEADRFGGLLPTRLKLEGLSYTSFREPLDANRRLQWIEPSQADHHYPGVYAELANAFRRAGRAGEAREILIANERRARQSLPKWSHRRLWHDILWVTIGYGYRNWLAGIWLVGLVLTGALIFSLGQDSFHSTGLHPPAFNPILYSVDVTIPVLELGQTRGWSAPGCLAWVGLALAISGYALAAAVIAAAAGLFARDQN